MTKKIRPQYPAKAVKLIVHLGTVQQGCIQKKASYTNGAEVIKAGILTN